MSRGDGTCRRHYAVCHDDVRDGDEIYVDEISGDAEPSVRLIRCKDCEFYDAAIHSCVHLDRLAGAFVSYVFDDDFCCWAEPREDL